MSISHKIVGVMGGSFNPVHIGHLIIADYIRQVAALDKVILMMSPQNPFKNGRDDLADNNCRMEMLRIACHDTPGLEASDIEVDMPRPSYTINTLERLSQEYPDTRFRLIIGSDNWVKFDRWRDYREIISRYGVIVYPRPGYLVEQPLPDGVTLVEAPHLEISATFIRDAIARGLDMNLFLPHGVYNYILQHSLYQQ